MQPIRIQKALSEAGVASRRAAEELVRQGRVTINGRKAEIGQSVNPDRDVIAVDGKRVYFARKKQYRYIMMNKPAGVLTATEDRHQRTVLDLLPQELQRQHLFPVGRLDKDTEGLLLLTNQGDLAHDLLSPKKHVDKEYGVRVEGRLTAADCAAVKAGLHLDDGLDCQPAELAILPNTGGREAHITIREGKFHQIKRMMAYLGKPVLYLERVRMGNLTLDSALPRGSWRFLTENEVRGLEIAVGEAEKNRNFNKK